MASTQIKPPSINTKQDKFNQAFEEQRDRKRRVRKIFRRRPNSETRSETSQESRQETSQESRLETSQESRQESRQELKTLYDSKLDPKKYTDDLGINIKNLFFDILEMLSRGINPMPYVMDDNSKQFTFAIMIISIGVLFMFFSNLMI
jgi:hypothetical protein